MIERIVESANSVTILGASDPKREDIDEALRLAPVLVAADGGAQFALSAGHLPEAVIGDFDSIPADVASHIPDDRLFRIADQDTTDFEKCLSRVAAPICLAVGFTGRRLDHELAVYSALVRHPAQRCIVIGAADVAFHAPDRLSLDLAPGTRVSLFPLTRMRATSTGLRWPVDQVPFDPVNAIGTSNEATGPVTLTCDRAGMLVILPRAALAAAMSALAPGQPAAPER